MPGGAPLSELAAARFAENGCRCARAAQLAGGRPPAVSRRRSHHRDARPRPISARAASPGVSTGRRCASIPRSGIGRDADAPRESWPGLLAAVTDPGGRITGVHRTWLDRARPDKAPLADPRRALGHLLGNGVRFPASPDRRVETEVLLAGEGIETVLSLKCVLPGMPMIAALSANHLAALDLAPMLARLYVARDRDAAGRMAAERLHARGSAAGIDVRDLVPVWGDFNEDLRRLGPERAPGASRRSTRAG